ncbi:hypothetical protein F4811DRAFT_554564 [Daldinia bambusicola]|nr:hypothetical protein F4811DRAFT_554564 [Daldinia bambusicola]
MSSNSTSADTSTPDSVSSPPESPTETSSPPAGTSSSTPPPPETTSTSTPDPPTSIPDPTTSTTPSAPSPPPPSPTTTTPTTTSSPETTSTSAPPAPTTTPTSTSPIPTPTTPSSSATQTPPPLSSSVVITTTHVTTGEDGSTSYVTVTSTELAAQPSQPTSQTSSTTGSSDAIISPGASNSPHMAEQAKIAVAVVVPIAAVALLVAAGIFFWRRRKQRKDAAEERRKEVEDYSYNPNNDPTLPEVGGAGAPGAYEMKEDGSGYRGWGSTTLAGSTGRKASTTMSGGAAGVAYSDATSPTRGNFSDTRSGDGLMNDRSNSPTEGEILGAMGPDGNTGNGDVRRGPSNASSSYSAAGRSDGSGDNGASYGGPAYLDQYGGNNPYADGAYGQPVIRDNPARRNTRIENPSHYPQQSTGISQNF